MLPQPTVALALLCLVFGLAAMIRGYRLFTSRLDLRRAVTRLYSLTHEETVERRLQAPPTATA